MSEDVEVLRDIRGGAEVVARLPFALGEFVCPHVASGERPAGRIIIDGGDVSAVCWEAACFEDEPELTSLYRILHYASDFGALGPAENGWSFLCETPDATWMAWAPGAEAPEPFNPACLRRH